MIPLIAFISLTAAPLTLEDVLGAAVERHPSMDAAQRDIEGAFGERLSARGNFDLLWRTRASGNALGYYRQLRVDTLVEQPTPWWGTTFFAGYRLGYGVFADYDGKLATNDFGEVRAGVSVPLWRNGPTDRRRANIDRAELAVKIAERGLDQQALELFRQGAQRYFNWVAAGLRRKIAKTVLALAEERDAALDERARAGDLPVIDRTDNQRAIAQRRQQLVAADRSLQQAAIELSLFFRDAKGNPVVPTDERLPAQLDEPQDHASDDAMKLAERAWASRPDSQRLALQGRQAEIEVRFAENQGAPAIDVFTTVSQDFGPGSDTRRPFELEAGVMIDIPILRRLQRGRIDSAVAAKGRVEAQERLLRDRIGAEVRDALSAMQAAHERLKAAREEVRLARELETLERDRFGLGDSTLLFVNIREQAAAEALVREVDALLDCYRAEIDFATAVADFGKLLRA